MSSNRDMSSDMSGDRTNKIRVSRFIRRPISICVFDLAFRFASHPLKTPGLSKSCGYVLMMLLKDSEVNKYDTNSKTCTTTDN